VWVAERCGANSCDEGKTDDPILEFDTSGETVEELSGGGMFVFPHGLYVDKDGNIWVTDGQGKDGKGHQVFKFSPDGKVLMTLGKAGVTGDGPDTFNAPSAVVVAPNGDIFVADGHGGNTNARIVKFDKNGKFIKTWGHKGSGDGRDQCAACSRVRFERETIPGRPAETIAFRFSIRMVNFWKRGPQFSRPSGIFIDKKDVMYVGRFRVERHESPGLEARHENRNRQGWICDRIHFPIRSSPAPRNTSAAEGVAADSKGVIYGAESRPERLEEIRQEVGASGRPQSASRMSMGACCRAASDSRRTITVCSRA